MISETVCVRVFWIGMIGQIGFSEFVITKQVFNLALHRQIQKILAIFLHSLALNRSLQEPQFRSVVLSPR